MNFYFVVDSVQNVIVDIDKVNTSCHFFRGCGVPTVDCKNVLLVVLYAELHAVLQCCSATARSAADTLVISIYFCSKKRKHCSSKTVTTGKYF